MQDYSNKGVVMNSFFRAYTVHGTSRQLSTAVRRQSALFKDKLIKSIRMDPFDTFGALEVIVGFFTVRSLHLVGP